MISARFSYASTSVGKPVVTRTTTSNELILKIENYRITDIVSKYVVTAST